MLITRDEIIDGLMDSFTSKKPIEYFGNMVFITEIIQKTLNPNLSQFTFYLQDGNTVCLYKNNLT